MGYYAAVKKNKALYVLIRNNLQNTELCGKSKVYTSMYGVTIWVKGKKNIYIYNLYIYSLEGCTKYR